MPLSAHDIQARATQILRDTRKLHTAAGLGFVAARAIVDDAVKALEATFTIVDARDGDRLAIRQRVIAAMSAKRPIAIVVAGAEPRGAHEMRAVNSFVRAAADRVPSVELGDGLFRAMPDDASTVLLVDGVAEHVRLPEELKRVDFWEFLPVDEKGGAP